MSCLGSVKAGERATYNSVLISPTLEIQHGRAPQSIFTMVRENEKRVSPLSTSTLNQSREPLPEEKDVL